MKAFLITVASFVLLIGMIVFANEFEIFGVKFWGVRKENAKREVFEQTQSYVEGKRQDLAKYHHEWVKSEKDTRESIEATIRIEFSNFDKNKILDESLRNWLSDIMSK